MVRPGPDLTEPPGGDEIAALADGVAELVRDARLDDLDTQDFTVLTLAVLEITLGTSPAVLASAAADAAAQLTRSPGGAGALVVLDDAPVVWWSRGGAPVADAELLALLRGRSSSRGEPVHGDIDDRQVLIVPVHGVAESPTVALAGIRPAAEAPFGAREVALLGLLGRLTAAGLHRAGRLVTERHARELAAEAARWQQLLGEASEALTGALTTPEVLQALEAAAVPALADAIAVALREGEGARMIHLRHRNPYREAALRAIAELYPITLDQPVGSGAVIASGQPQLLPEITDDLLRQIAETDVKLHQLRSLSLSSGVIVPLKARGTTIGAVTLIRDDGGHYTERELSFALALAERAGLAIEGTMRFEAERELTEELRRNLEARGRVEAILLGQRDVFAQIARGEQLEVILDSVCRTVETLSPPGVRAAVAILDETGSHLVDAAAPSLGAGARRALHDVPLLAAAGPPAAAVLSGRPHRCDDIERDRTWGAHRRAAIDEGLRRCWAAPIRSSVGQPLGAFVLYSPAQVDDDALDHRVIDIFVESAAIAIERERDREALVAQRRLVQSVLEQMPAGVVVVALPKGEVLLANDPARRLFDLTSAGPAETDAGPVAAHPLLGPLLAGVIDDGAVIQGDELTISRGDGHVTVLVTAGPVRNRKGEAVAAVATFHDITQRKGAERRMAAQHAVSHVLASASHEVDVGPAVLESLGRSLGWTAGCLWTVDRRRQQLECTATWADDGVDATDFLDASRAQPCPRGRGLPGRAWDAHEAMWIHDLGAFEEDFPRREGARHAGLRHAVAAPIVVRGRVRGVIEMFSPEPASEDPDLLAAMAAIGNQLGVHLERRQAELSLRESRQRFADLATTLQTSLLPPALPIIPGTELAAFYEAGEAGVEVGGDFYDMFQMGRRDWLVVIGDVCGKGAEAATVTALARFTLRGAAMRTRRLPAILESLNQAVLRHPTDLFCTVALVRVRQEEEGLALQVACAGHPRPHLLRPDGSVEQVGGAGPLIGVLEQHRSESESVLLPPGAALLLYTDGLVEARAGRQLYGQDRLRSVLRRCAGQPADAVIGAVAADLRRFEERRRDDVAMVALRAV